MLGSAPPKPRASGVLVMQDPSALQMPILGIKLPNMGIQSTAGTTGAVSHRNLGDALFTQTQQRLLGALFGEPDRAFALSELITATGGGSGAIQRELARFTGAGLVDISRLANQKRYQANPHAPIHDELVSIVQKTFGLAGPLRAALNPVYAEIALAFVYGSVAKRMDTGRSDIDLMILSNTLGYADVMQCLDGTEKTLGRLVNPTLYSQHEFASRIQDQNSFLMRVMSQPKIWVIGGAHELSTAAPGWTGQAAQRGTT